MERRRPASRCAAVPFLSDIFGETGNVTATQECARALLIFAYGLVIVRLAGRRVFGKWSALDIIVSIIVGSNLSRALTGGAALFGTILATTLLMGMHWLLAQIAVRSRPLSYLIEGRPVELAKDGVPSSELRRHAISQSDLGEALRQSGLESVENARRVTLEPSGRITVLKRK